MATIRIRTRQRALSKRSRHVEIDVAVVWGPLAGYFAGRQPIKLRITPVSPLVDVPASADDLRYLDGSAARGRGNAQRDQRRAKKTPSRYGCDPCCIPRARVNELAAQLP